MITQSIALKVQYSKFALYSSQNLNAFCQVFVAPYLSSGASLDCTYEYTFLSDSILLSPTPKGSLIYAECVGGFLYRFACCEDPPNMFFLDFGQA